MASQPRRHVSTATLVEGYEGARSRFAAANTGTDADALFHAPFEVVAWAGTIRKRLKDDGEPPCPSGQGRPGSRSGVVKRS